MKNQQKDELKVEANLKLKFKILSIDAWAGAEPGTWEWNNWHRVSTYYESEYGELTEESALKCFATKLSTSIETLEKDYYIDDDQYNLVLCNKKTHQPYYAIEYGSEYL